jgi:N utilization substance protein B
MQQRRKAREFALQSLYALEMGQENLELSQKKILDGLSVPENVLRYGKDLVDTVLKHCLEVDTYIQDHTENWDFERIALLDKLLLRCSVAEMLYMADVPVTVSIAEAIQIAKKYSTEQSPRFVNGVLDSIAKKITHASTSS